MTELNPGRARVRRAPVAAAAAAAAALALAGCSSTHVGESWQCPLAQGSECTSVAAADPAVPERAGSGTVRVLGEPLYRVRSEGDGGGARETARAGTPCDSGCGPFAWLARLFATDGGAAPAGSGVKSGAANDTAAGSVAGSAAGSAARPAARAVAGAALPPSTPDGRAPLVTAPGGAGPAPDDRAPVETARADPAGDDLREAEVLGRIWIAPFVDWNGIYREASHVRVVLEPAGWRLR